MYDSAVDGSETLIAPSFFLDKANKVTPIVNKPSNSTIELAEHFD